MTPPPDELRAADSDRQKVAERLRQAAEEGRLDLDEFDGRLARAYGAKTYGELDRLLTDLPVPAHATLSYPAAAWQWLVAQWWPLVSAVCICTVIWIPAMVLWAELVFWLF
jgi:Domain of unknown function (DUF1707)